MRTSFATAMEHHSRPIVAVIRSLANPQHQAHRSALPALPFVTIARQAGAGGHTLANALVERLRIRDGSDHPWHAWDRDLAEKIAAEHHVNSDDVEKLEQMHHSWLADLFQGMAVTESDAADEYRIYRRVAATIRSLAQDGRAIIVGMAGVFLTSDVPGGIHIDLIAPLDYRIANFARIRDISLGEASLEVRRLQRQREGFYHRYWPNRALAPEAFLAIYNTSKLTDQQLADSVLCLIPKSRAA